MEHWESGPFTPTYQHVLHPLLGAPRAGLPERKIAPMKAFFGLWVMVVACAAAPARADHPVMTVVGEVIAHDGCARSDVGPAELQRLAEALRARIFRHYVAHNGLAATAEEISALAEYNVEFRQRDREQRARKLAELEQRLAAQALSPEARAHLEDFRATLARLAAYEAEQDRTPPPDGKARAENYAPWIEMWKLHGAIYERFGGTVALQSFGHYPQGAWAALIADYEHRGTLRFHDAALRARVLSLFGGPPQITVAPHQVDFTPYWRRPIPSSYFPDDPPAAEKREQ